MERKKILVSTFYKFKTYSPEELEALKVALDLLGARLDLKGLILIGTEGLNATVSGTPEAMEQLKKEVVLLTDKSIWFKDTWCEFKPFARYKVKIKPEIVTLGRPDLVPDEDINHHLSPADWHNMMEQEDVVVIDTRNTYETDIGIFKDALDFRIDDFQEFTAKFKEQNFDKDKKIMIYCTGGIRCEKAILELQELGYKNVYQLNGGILNYMKEYPNGKWEGECFVFDHRVALDKNLEPSKQYSLCPHCGNPGDKLIECAQCGIDQIACGNCLDESEHNHTCSKNCAHHHKMGHKTTKPHMDSIQRRFK